MADFAPNFTARYRLKYTVMGKTHTQQWRIARGAGVTGLNNMILKVAAFWAALPTILYSSLAFVSATYAPEDSDVFLPAAVPTQPTGALAAPAQPLSQSILATSFVGRSNLGQKARVFIYGLAVGPEDSATTGDNFRTTGAESTPINNAVVVLNNGSPNIVASDNAVVGWYVYCNQKYNDYWLRKVR